MLRIPKFVEFRFFLNLELGARTRTDLVGALGEFEFLALVVELAPGAHPGLGLVAEEGVPKHLCTKGGGVENL